MFVVWKRKEREHLIGGATCFLTLNGRSNSSMRGILAALARRDVCDVVLFPESTIVNEPIESWPHCDFLLCFESTGFPLDKGARARTGDAVLESHAPR